MSKRGDKGKSSVADDDIPDAKGSMQVIRGLEDILFQAQLPFDKGPTPYDNPVFAMTDEISRLETSLVGVLSIVQKIASDSSLPLTGTDLERANRISSKISKIKIEIGRSTKRVAVNVDRLTTDTSNDEQTHYHSRGRSKSRGSVKVHHSRDSSPEGEEDHDGKGEAVQRKKKNPEDEGEEDAPPKDEDRKRKGGERTLPSTEKEKGGDGGQKKVKDDSKHRATEKDGDTTSTHDGSRHRHGGEKKVPAEGAIKHDDRKQTNGHQTGKSPPGEASGETAWGVPAPTKSVSSSDRGGLNHGPRRPAPAK